MLNEHVMTGFADELEKIAVKVPGWVLPAAIGTGAGAATAGTAGAVAGHKKGKKTGRREGARTGLRIGHRAGLRRGYRAGQRHTVRQLQEAIQRYNKAKTKTAPAKKSS